MATATDPARSTTAARRGPRSDRGELATAILRAARESFATKGFEATSLRAVATSAGVDASLVNYYFTNKEGLLEAVLRVPAAYLAPLEAAVVAPLTIRGRSMLAAYLSLCDGADSGDVLRSILLCAAREPQAVERLREIFIGYVSRAVTARARDDERRRRTGLVASNIIGLSMTRYVWRVGPLAELTSDEVVTLLAPTLQRYLADRLP